MPKIQDVNLRLQYHLDGVSRSFAACIRELERPLYEWTAMAYLTCRLLDTVEDAPWPQAEARAEALCTFASLTQQHGRKDEEVLAWAQTLPRPLPQAESELVEDTAWLLAQLDSVTDKARTAIVATVTEMAQGMESFARRWGAEGMLKLRDGAEVDRYCYVVAGVVGGLLSDLFGFFDVHFHFTQQHRQDAYHFGLFLQKVNLLKDQREDEAQGRFLLPSRESVVASLKHHSHRALAYILALPRDATTYRTFCAWSLMLGASSLPVILAPDPHAPNNKIPRQKTQQLFDAVRRIAGDNEQLSEQFNTAWAALTPMLPHGPMLEAFKRTAAGVP